VRGAEKQVKREERREKKSSCQVKREKRKEQKSRECR